MSNEDMKKAYSVSGKALREKMRKDAPLDEE